MRRTKWLYEDDLIEPASRTLSSGILFMNKPYNVTDENVDVFHKLARTKLDLRAEAASIESERILTVRYWVYLFVILIVCYAYQAITRGGKFDNLFFIFGVGLIVIVSLCILLFIYKAICDASAQMMSSKAIMVKHEQLIMEMNLERRKMVHGDGNLALGITDQSRMAMEFLVDHDCKDIYSPLYRPVGLPFQVVLIIGCMLIALCSLVEVVGSKRGLK